jgi:hypothetical protein
MKKNPTAIAVVQEGEDRFLVQTFADGSWVRQPIVKLPRKLSRSKNRKKTFDKSRKKGF